MAAAARRESTQAVPADARRGRPVAELLLEQRHHDCRGDRAHHDDRHVVGPQHLLLELDEVVHAARL